MSEGDVSLIHDEDVLRRMWQQTEDFSRKKEIRAHMYRLREERLRNLYSPEPSARAEGKGHEYTPQTHVTSFADQSFQSMKSKEVRDAGSPPKEFTYRGQDLKDLSNAGWNVESENKTTDDGHTHIKSVNANIEGRYDVEGGKGHFAAVDHHKQAVTEYHDENTSLKRNESSSNTAAREQVVRKTDDGTQFSSTTSSSSTSKFQQVSSTKHESVPYLTNDDYDRKTSHDTNRNEDVTRITRRNNNYEQNLRSESKNEVRSVYGDGELESRKVDYPDEHTRVVVETRRLPDGTRVTSTRREFRAPVQSSHSEQNYQSRSESKSYSSQHKSDIKDSSSRVTRHTIERANDIVDSQRNVDDNDFKRQITEYTRNNDDEYSDTQSNQRYVTRVNRKVTDSHTDDDYSQTRQERVNRRVTDHSTTDNNYSETIRKEHTATDTNDRTQTVRRDHTLDKDDHAHITRRITADENDQIHTVRRDHLIDEDGRIQNQQRVIQQRKDLSVNDTNRRELITTRDDHHVDVKETHHTRDTEEHIHHITRDSKVDEVVERKTSTEQYKTTYQADFPQKKISNDWSPTHQAWASTLRSDTPSTTRPSTRASSPGSRTFKSSTSSLRSSVSPDKTYRKPSSRGGSPSKVDRYSPTRTVSDRYSSTHSTHSVTEEKNNRYTSPERKPPTGRSPTRPGYSPDRKPQDGRQRPSMSPEKKPQEFTKRPSASPERKSPNKSIPSHPRSGSPSGPVDRPKSHSPSKSPERKPGYQAPSSTSYPRQPSPYRSTISPDKIPKDERPKNTPLRTTESPERKPSTKTSQRRPSPTPIDVRNTSPSRQPKPGDVGSNKPSKTFEKKPDGHQPTHERDEPSAKTPKRDSVSPDRKPGFMKATDSSNPIPTELSSPTKPRATQDRKSPEKQVPSQSPARKPHDTITKAKEDHYKFIDEETKTHTHTSVEDYRTTVSSTPDQSRLREKSPSPLRKTPSEDTPDFCKSPSKPNRAPSPPKGPVSLNNEKQTNQVDLTQFETTNKKTDVTESVDVTTIKYIPTEKDTLTKNKSPERETSPDKFGTYSKKKPNTDVIPIEVADKPIKETKDIYDSITKRDKTSPKKVTDIPSSPIKRSPRDSVSPTKSPIKDTKYKHTTDFLSTERTTEEINKRTTTKDRPRQLLTPSSSPTRKPKVTDTEPSTGQSSPTTSVSGFVYFGSPRTERPVVTDLDDQDYPEFDKPEETFSKRPENLEVKPPSSPSKIPCRSPSPEKRVSPAKESLPRKSSLKKPSTDNTLISPVEKPPTSFRVSPTDDTKDFPDHIIVKKDRPESSPIKPKPPLERRETYEDRCRKILGMMSDTITTEKVAKETKNVSKEPKSNLSSPSVSPCESPAIKESSPFEDYSVKKKSTKTVVTDFITSEQEDIIKTTTDRRSTHTNDKKSKPSRESSPTKLHDSISKTVTKCDETNENITEDTVVKTIHTKFPSPRQSPERKPGKPSEKKPSSDNLGSQFPKGISPKTTREEPDRTPGFQKPTQAPKDNMPYTTEQHRSTSPSKAPQVSRHSVSPDRKSQQPTSNIKQPNENLSRPNQASDFYETTTVTSAYDSQLDSTEDIHETLTSSIIEKKYPSTPSEPQSKGYEHPQAPANLRKPSKPETDTSLPKKRDTSSDGKSGTQQPQKIGNEYPRDSSPTKESINKAPLYSRITKDLEEHSEYSEDFEETAIDQKSTDSFPDTVSPNRRHVSDNPPKRQDSPNRKPDYTQPSKDHSEKPGNEKPRDSSPSKPIDKIPGYMRATTAATSKHQTTTVDDTEELTSTLTEKRYPSKPSDSHIDQQSIPEDAVPSKPLRPSDGSPRKQEVSPERKPSYRQPSSPTKDSPVKKPGERYPKETSPTRPVDKTPGFTKNTTSITSQYDASSTIEYDITSEDRVTNITKKIVENKRPSSRPGDSPTRRPSSENQPKSTKEYPRTVSPSKHTQPSDSTPKRQDLSPGRKPGYQQPSSPNRGSPTKVLGDKYTKEKSPTKPTDQTPGYMKTTKSISTKHDITEAKYDSISTTENTEESISIEKKVLSKVPAPERSTQRPRAESPSKEIHPCDGSPKKQDSSPVGNTGNRKPSSPIKDSPTRNITDKYPKESSPSQPVDKKPGYIKPTTSVTSKYNETEITEFDRCSSEDIEEVITTKVVERKHPSTRLSQSPNRDIPKSYTHDQLEHIRPKYQQPSSPTKNSPSVTQEVHPNKTTPTKVTNESINKPVEKRPNDTTTVRRDISPDKKTSYTKPTVSVTSKYDTTSTTTDTDETFTSETVDRRRPTPRSSVSPSRQTPDVLSKPKAGYLTKPDEPRQLRTPSPIKKHTKTTEVTTDFILSEREQEVLDRVQKSLRQLSPDRKDKSPTREKSPNKTTTSLHDLDITNESVHSVECSNDLIEVTGKHSTVKVDVIRSGKPKEEKPKDHKPLSKPTSRNVSPIKKAPITSTKVDKSPESPTKSRSISPKKPVSQTERPQSPQIPKASGIKPRDPVPSHLTRKPTPATITTSRIEKLSPDAKKMAGVVKQNTYSKTSTTKTTIKSIPSPTSKSVESDTKRAPTPKGINSSLSPKKETDTKVTRTASDTTLKPKKTSPQRMKSKPEIQVSDMSTTKTTTKIHKSIGKEPHSKLPSKPKSATALNTSTDEDDIIIDVQQSKSSRENSPDRICPTPINFADDVGTPRFPDEVSEPDDDFVKRTHHTIHEAESIVDDIVEICEDDELFVKRPDVEDTEYDDSLLSVNDKVSKFTNKIQTVTKPKDTTTVFKDTERRVHSDYIDENLKSDECLLTVSEKVNKFAKGPRDTKDSRSPSRKIVDEYDKDTIYQDDYTKLSVNDKAHLFVETAENVKVPKLKPAQKVERPDMSNVDDSLKSDDCLLSVSDKVNKFVKTAEHYFTETHEVDEKEKKIKEQHEKIMRQFVDEDEEDDYDDEETTEQERNVKETEKDKNYTKVHQKHEDSFVKESTLHAKVKDHPAPSPKTAERIPAMKVTTLRSSEAVKKAKALFENIASTTQKPKEPTHTKAKLTDIGVMKKFPKTESITVHHPSAEDVSHHVNELDVEIDVAPQTPTLERPPSGTLIRPRDEKPRSSPNRLTAKSPEVPRSRSPVRQTVETTTTKTALTRNPTGRAESPKHRQEPDKHDKVPGYLRPTKTSQNKEEVKVVEDNDVSSRRGSGKFGVELRRTSVERSTVSSERRRSSVEHHQPCIEDIFDLDLLEQMLEKVVGYEQRRRIRAQIRVAKKESEHVETNTYTKTSRQTTVAAPKNRSPERHPQARSPDRVHKTIPHKTVSPDRHSKNTSQSTLPDRSHPREPSAPILNGHGKEPSKTVSDKRPRPQSPEKKAPKSTLKTKSPVRQVSPDKRTHSPSKAAPKPKSNRFSEYQSAYMKKVGLNEDSKLKFSEAKTKKVAESKQTVKHVDKQETVEEFTSTKSFNERTLSKEVIEVVNVNGKRSPSPEKRQSPDRREALPERKAMSPDRKALSPEPKTAQPERKRASPERKASRPERTVASPEPKATIADRKAASPERMYERATSPEYKRQKSDTSKKETIIKTVYDIEKKIQPKPTQEEKPSWVTNRNLKKITSETRTFSTKKLETEKPKYRAPSPSKVISKPIDVITSSYGPGPLDADGKPLFGIKALRNGASNYQVKGTVIRQEFHSRNGGEPEGSVSVTAYSTEPEALARLLAPGDAPSRLHGLAAITTTKKFGGDSGNSYTDAHTKEDRATLDQFTHSDRKIESFSECHSYESSQDIQGDSWTEDRDMRRIESKRDDRIPERSAQRKDERVTEVKTRGKVEDRKEKVERREDRKTVRQSSVKSLTEKYIKSANEGGKSERAAYPKAGLILRTATMKDSVSSDSSAHAGLARSDSCHSLGSVDDSTVVTTTHRGADGSTTTTTTTTRHQHHSQQLGEQHERSFLDSNTKVTGVQDIITRMKNADIVINPEESAEDSEARALLNKFLGASVLMAGMQAHLQPAQRDARPQEILRSSTDGGQVTLEEIDLDQCWDERVLKKLLDECTDYEQRRRLRARIRTLMAEQEACASAVTDALAAAGEATEPADIEAREEEEVTVTSSVRRNSSEKTVSSSTTTKTSKVIESMTRAAPKQVSPFAKFRQLEKQNSTNSPKM